MPTGTLGSSIVAVSLLVIQSSAWAQPRAGALRDIEELDLGDLLSAPVITASGIEQEAAMAPAEVFSISRDEIAQHGWQSVAEAIASTPGLYVTDDLVLPSVSVRGVSGGIGAGTRIIRVMINGMQVNFRPSLSALLGPEFIPIDTIERIEVAKGPLSALYGANAFLATINVITRTPSVGGRIAARLRAGDHFRGQGASALAMYAADHVEVMVAYAADSTDRSGIRVRRTFEGQDPTLPAFTPLYDRRNVSEGDTADPESGFVHLRVTQEALGSLTVQAGLQRLNSAAEFQLNSLYTHHSRIALNNSWTSLRYENRWFDLISLDAMLGYSEGAPDRSEQLFLTGNDTRVFKRNFDYEAWDGSLKLSAAFGRDYYLAAGVDFARELQTVLYYSEILNVGTGASPVGTRRDIGITPADPRQVRLSNLALFAQATGSVPGLRDLQLTFNARRDQPGDIWFEGRDPETLFPDQTSFRGAMVYRWSKGLVTRLLVGQAFQTPSAVLLFANPGFGNQGNIIGNRTLPGREPLVPQRIRSASLGLSMSLFGGLSVQGNGYVQEVRDPIIRRTGTNFIAENTEGSQQAAGAEFTSLVVLGSVRPYLTAAFHRNLESTDETGVRVIPPHPEWVVLAGVNHRLTRANLNINAEGRYVSARGSTEVNTALNRNQPYTLPAYVTFDLAVSSDDLRLLAGQETKLMVALRNVTDARHQEPGYSGFDLPILGRTLLFEWKQDL